MMSVKRLDVNENPEMRLSHDDVGKRREDWDPEYDVGGESVFDIEGDDDVPPELSKKDLREFRYGVIKEFTFGTDDDANLKKIKYIFRELLVDLGVGRFDPYSIITSIIALLFALWTRIFIHYGFQYVFLKLIDVPVTGVHWGWY